MCKTGRPAASSSPLPPRPPWPGDIKRAPAVAGRWRGRPGRRAWWERGGKEGKKERGSGGRPAVERDRVVSRHPWPPPLPPGPLPVLLLATVAAPRPFFFHALPPNLHTTRAHKRTGAPHSPGQRHTHTHALTHSLIHSTTHTFFPLSLSRPPTLHHAARRHAKKKKKKRTTEKTHTHTSG